MSILNVNQIQPVGSGQTVTISATNIDTGSATVTAGTFTGNLTGNVTGNVTSSSTSTFSNGLNVTGGTIGIGTIPKTWTSGYNVLQVGSASLVGQSEQDGQTTNWSNNAYFDTNNNRWEYSFADQASQITQSDGLIIFKTASTGTANAALSWTESARFNTSGNLAFPSGQGIDFSATSDASGRTSELLDDYEEGTWTPVLEGSTTNPTYSGTQSGDYTKVGNMVTCWGYIDTNPVTGAGSGNISISGLPFASGLPSASTYNGSVAVWGPTFSGTLSSRINNASTSIIFYQIASNTGISQWTFATASWSSGDAIYFQVSYTVG